ncbi:hypothetical protein [Ancylobacter amanitiformis]|uniref:Uncharacterized protein n=1 Tax=Ancylobacter amanitiformis TaxID=217069 RepID=A0ABU0LSK7_9HYPH|nr:hypothetical protein [Ancylobacter amanitiformis]MDQ0511668.1 hypothetical protein [Ancylobacter amanitiformis]
MTLSAFTNVSSPTTLPTTDAQAIAFALDHLEPYEVPEFLKDWRDGKSLRPWMPDGVSPEDDNMVGED